jgi:hypothetical protein
MKSTSLFSVLFLLIFTGATAQNGLEHHWGRQGYDAAFSVAATSDGGYVISGLSQSMGDTVGDIIVIKVNSQCDTQWTLLYGGPKLEGGNAVMETSDGGIMVSGHTEDFGARDCDAFLMKLDKDGNRQWLKVYGGDEDDIAEGAAELPDGGFVFAGITASYGNPVPAETRHCWFVRTNSTGDTQWAKCYGGNNTDYAYSIAGTASGGFLAVGYTRSRDQGEEQGWLLRLKDNGDTLWTRTYGSNGDTRFTKILPVAGNCFIVVGITQTQTGARTQGLMIKLDAEGKELWRKTYGDGEGIAFQGVAQLPTGSLMIAGGSQKADTNWNAYLLMTDENGNRISDKLLGGTGGYANAVAIQGNNNWMLAGFSKQWDPLTDIFYTENSNMSVPELNSGIEKVYLFPNPVKTKSSLRIPDKYAFQQVHIDVINAQGKQVSCGEDVLGKNAIIDKRNLPAGQYLYRVSCKDGEAYTGKFAVE